MVNHSTHRLPLIGGRSRDAALKRAAVPKIRFVAKADPEQPELTGLSNYSSSPERKIQARKPAPSGPLTLHRPHESETGLNVNTEDEGIIFQSNSQLKVSFKRRKQKVKTSELG